MADCAFPYFNPHSITLDSTNTHVHSCNSIKLKARVLEAHAHYELHVFSEGGHLSLMLCDILTHLNDLYDIIRGTRGKANLDLTFKRIEFLLYLVYMLLEFLYDYPRAPIHVHQLNFCSVLVICKPSLW